MLKSISCPIGFYVGNRLGYADNSNGIYIYSPYPFTHIPLNNVLTSNIALNNTNGIRLGTSSNNLIYNNYLTNIKNAYDKGTNNKWNTTNTTGPNIIGGPYIGGNYWSDYTGNDINGDGFGEEPYDNIGGGSNMDNLPLVHVQIQGICGDLDGNGVVNIMDVRLLMNNVSGAGYTVDSWAGDVDGDYDIDRDDVWLLVRHVFDPILYQLNCR